MSLYTDGRMSCRVTARSLNTEPTVVVSCNRCDCWWCKRSRWRSRSCWRSPAGEGKLPDGVSGDPLASGLPDFW
eukprot:scaffold3415_cov368-Prasinococcus_capsulatus_cf.AAC.3